MESLQATYMEEEDDEQEIPTNNLDPSPATALIDPIEHQNGVEEQQDDMENGDPTKHPDPIMSGLSESDPTTPKSPKFEDIEEEEEDEDEDDEEEPPPKKQKQLSSLTQQEEEEEEPAAIDDTTAAATTGDNEIKTPASTQATAKKKWKKKNNNNVWVTRSTRKGKKKTKPNPQNAPAEDKVLITPVPRFPDKSDDSSDMTICLSKVFKAERVELSEDRMSAGSTKGYRMVRATRGVCEGAWYFEIKVASLGESGHTRLGWSTEKGDLQGPVGYDGHSFAYRDIDGSKVHKASREKYGEEGYKEGDVIGFYINLPEGSLYNPKPPHLVWYKGQRYVCAPDAKDPPPLKSCPVRTYWEAKYVFSKTGYVKALLSRIYTVAVTIRQLQFTLFQTNQIVWSSSTLVLTLNSFQRISVGVLFLGLCMKFLIMGSKIESKMVYPMRTNNSYGVLWSFQVQRSPRNLVT